MHSLESFLGVPVFISNLFFHFQELSCVKKSLEESASHQEMDDSDFARSNPEKNPVKARRRYRDSWKSEFPWVKPDPNGGPRAYCSLCLRSLDPRVSTLVSLCVNIKIG